MSGKNALFEKAAVAASSLPERPDLVSCNASYGTFSKV